VTADQMSQVVEFYAKVKWEKIRGYRPFTHKAFVDGLGPDDRKQLAQELADHIKAEGWKGDDAIGDRPAPPRSATAAAALGGGAAAAGTPAAAAAPVDPSPVPLYAGSYRTSEGGLTLTQTAADPHSVNGRYAKGTMSCHATGDDLECRWLEHNAAGGARFKRQPNGDMKGTWGVRSSATDGGKWTCTLLAAGQLD
jgi:hypothetical protein